MSAKLVGEESTGGDEALTSYKFVQKVRFTLDRGPLHRTIQGPCTVCSGGGCLELAETHMAQLHTTLFGLADSRCRAAGAYFLYLCVSVCVSVCRCVSVCAFP